jgi:hypothetical protein
LILMSDTFLSPTIYLFETRLEENND